MTQPTLACPLCKCEDFQHEESRQPGRWNATSHIMTLLICQNCRYVLRFYDKHSIFGIG